MYDTRVSVLPRLILLLLHNMRNEQICKTTNIYWRSASLYTLLAIRIRIGIKITLFSLNWKGAFKASNETYGNWEHKSSSTNFQVKIMKKKKIPGVTNVSTTM